MPFWAARLGLGRVVALCHRSSSLYHISLTYSVRLFLRRQICDRTTLGKADYHPSFIVSLLSGIRAMVASFHGAEVAHAAGSSVSGNTTNTSLLDAAVAVASAADVLVVCIGIDLTIEHEGGDSPGR